MHIFYRASEINTPIHEVFGGVRPSWFDKRVCFKSLYDSVVASNIKCDITVIMDNAGQGNLEEYVRKFDVSVVPINHRSHIKSLMMAYDMIDSIKDNEHIYLVEDDYLHTSDAIAILNEGINKFEMVTCYDHPDRYDVNVRCTDVTQGNEMIDISESTHWRTIEATTHTFGFSRHRYEVIKDYLRIYTEDRPLFRRLYLDRGLRLWSPMLGRSTHLNRFLMSPFVDWEEVNNNSKEV